MEVTKYQNIVYKFFIIICLFFFSYAFLSTVLNFVRNFSFNTLHIFLILLYVLGFILLVVFTNRFIKDKYFTLFLVLISFISRFIWILVVETPPISDFGLMYYAATQAANGDYGFAQTGYFTTWVYQLGYTMYQAVIISIFGEGTFFIKLFNIFYSVGTAYLIYKIATKLFNPTAGKIAGLTYAIFIPNIVMASVLTNQHLATFLFYLGFYLFIRYWETNKFIWLVVGVLLALGDIARPLGSLILLAMGIYLFVEYFLNKKNGMKWRTIKYFSGVLVVYFAVHLAISQLFISLDITEYELSNRDPLWKFVLGFNHETKGRYSASDAEYVGQFEVGEERNEVELELIKERLSNIKELPMLFNEKFKLMWGANDDSIFWSIGHFSKPDIMQALQKVERLFYAFIVFFGAISCLSLLRSKNPINNSLHLFVLLILGYVAVHLLIEIQTRYRYFIIPSFVILQSYGMYLGYQYIKGKVQLKLKKS